MSVRVRVRASCQLDGRGGTGLAQSKPQPRAARVSMTRRSPRVISDRQFAVQLKPLYTTFPIVFSSCCSKVTIGFIPTVAVALHGVVRRHARELAPPARVLPDDLREVHHVEGVLRRRGAASRPAPPHPSTAPPHCASQRSCHSVVFHLCLISVDHSTGPHHRTAVPCLSAALAIAEGGGGGGGGRGGALAPGWWTPRPAAPPRCARAPPDSQATRAPAPRGRRLAL